MSVKTEATQWKAVMEFANGERNYAFAEGEQIAARCAKQTDEAVNLLRM